MRKSTIVTIAVVAMLYAPAAMAAQAGGGGLPWDMPLQMLRDDLTGSVALSIALVAMFAAGAALIFGGEMNYFVRAILVLVMVAAMLVNAQNFMAALGIMGAVV